MPVSSPRIRGFHFMSEVRREHIARREYIEEIFRQQIDKSHRYVMTELKLNTPYIR